MKNRSLIPKLFAFVAAVLAVGALSTAAVAADKVVGFAVKSSLADGGIDFENAIPMPLPTPDERAMQESFANEIVAYPGPAGAAGGGAGNGQRAPVSIPPSTAVQSAFSDIFESQEFGATLHPFTTSRVDNWWNVSSTQPFSRTGKLYFKIGTASYVCSASLIKRGVIVTAAHCVANFGKNQFYNSWVFVPALSGASAPYGSYTGAVAWVLSSYYNGTDVCAAGAVGVVCKNDVAVIRLNMFNGAYPGTRVGWYGYGWNGWGFNSSKQILINQLGYPVSHDSGLKMQRTDSQGFVNASMAGNTVWGGRQTGGSSGGPELTNLGVAPVLSGGVTYGSYAAYNMVIGVTSWGYTNQVYKQQGASPFLSTNIALLVATACGAAPYHATCQ